MNKTVEEMTLAEMEEFLKLTRSSQIIDDKAAQELLKMCAELVRRAKAQHA